MIRKIAAVLFLSLLMAMMLTCGAQLSRGTTSSRPNSLGAPQEYQSPYSYFLGSARKVTILGSDEKAFTNVEFAPYGASMLNTETIMFCGDVAGGWDTRTKVYVYRRIPHTSYQGVACHELIRVFNVEGQ